MTINRIFLIFMIACGIVTGVILVAAPESRNFVIAPYFWVLIAMALFEGIAFWRGRGAPGTNVTMDMRMVGFIVAIVLMIAIPVLAGSPGRLF